jgi:hypothetical protein
MCFELLKRLSCLQLPMNIDDPIEIEQLAELKNEGMIEADIPQTRQEINCQPYAGHAIVMRVTARGHQACMPSTET